MKNTNQNNPYALLEQESKPIMEIVGRYLKHWPWFVVFIGLGLAGGFVISKLSEPAFQVESKILIKGENNPLKSNVSFDNIFGASGNSNMSNQMEILQSYSNYKRALENLNWGYTWYKPGKPHNIELYKFDALEVAFPLDAENMKGRQVHIRVKSKDTYEVYVKTEAVINGEEQKIEFTEKGSFGKAFKNEYFHFILYNSKNISSGSFFFVINNLNRMAQAYLKRVQVEVVDNNSDVIKMQLTGRIPEKEADFLNELNRVFISLGVEEEARNSQSSLNFINEQLGKVKDSLDRTQKVFTDFRQKNNAMDLSQEADFVYKRLEEIESELFQAKMRLDYYQNMENYLDDAEHLQKTNMPSTAGIEDQNLSAMLQKLTELYNRKEVLSYSVKEKSPSYILLEREIALVRNDLKANLGSLINNTKNQIAGINKRNSEIQNRLRKLPQTEKEMIGIQRNFELTNNTYNYLLKKKAEAELSQASTAPKVQIIDEALPESAIFVGSGAMKTLMMGFGLGFMIPFLFIYFADLLNRTLRNEGEVEDKTDLPVFSSIYAAAGKGKLPVVDMPRSGLTESFRALRYHVKNLMGDPEKIVISVNSVMPGEGKSFVASNLAAIMAKSGKTVLLVGSDMRKPTLEGIFNQNSDKGLSSVLSGVDDLEAAVQTSAVDNLFLLLAGKIPSNPTELLESDAFTAFMAKARAKYDYILFDNAPVSLVPDGMIVSKQADLSLFVTRINKSHRNVVDIINKTVDNTELGNVSLVVNGVSLKTYSKAYIKKGYHSYNLKV